MEQDKLCPVVKKLKIADMKNVTDFEDILIGKYGKKELKNGTNMTQTLLHSDLVPRLKRPEKRPILHKKNLLKKSYISRIERGLSDIQVSTYYKLIEIGLGKHSILK